MMKMIKGWRTVAINTTQAILGVLATVNWDVIAANPRTAAIIATCVAIANVVLRFDTDGPVGQR